MTTAILVESALGSSIPPYTPHAVSVSLPTWRDVVGYEEGDKRVVDVMVTGYPRFFIHTSIKKLAHECEQKFGAAGESCMLFPTRTIADQCRSFMVDRTAQTGSPVQVRLVQFLICPGSKSRGATPQNGLPKSSSSHVELHIVLFPSTAFPVAKQFWQHTGMGISSRLAEYCLDILPGEYPSANANRHRHLPSRGYNKHYHVKDRSPPPSDITLRRTWDTPPSNEAQSEDYAVYVEERYGRNLPLHAAASAKRALRRRIAGVLVRDDFDDRAGEPGVEVGPSTRGVREVTEDDVYLYPTGMTAIWQAHHLALAVRPATKSVCFGFPYTDTLKILQKWGPGCHFLGHGLDSDIDNLNDIIHTELSTGGCDTPPILALFTEFPSNPLLRSPDLARLRALADQHDFLIVVDETVGNFVNVEVLPYADIVVSSLTKVFSGDANVMGGSLVLNPKGKYYSILKARLREDYEDIFFNEDAIFMERNSRDFRSRIQIINENTEAVCDLLRSRSVSGGAASPVIKEVFYPKWITSNTYAHCRVKSSAFRAGHFDGGYGGLFSLTFISTAASQAFFDALPCHKGPSLGTNFTLACPYSILAHYTELDWAAQYGVEEGLVRVSVGMEDRSILLEAVGKALAAAERTLHFA